MPMMSSAEDRKIITKLLEFFQKENNIDMGYWPTDSFEDTVSSYCKYAEEDGLDNALEVMSVTISELANNSLKSNGTKYLFIDYDNPKENGYIEFSVEDIKNLIEKF